MQWFTQFPQSFYIDIKKPIDTFIGFMIKHWKPFFDTLSTGLRTLLLVVKGVLGLIPWWALLILIFIAAQRVSKKTSQALLYTVLLFFIGTIGLWDLLYDTLTIVLASVLISLVLGFPMGILVSASKGASIFVRPLLDTMQTMPSFVYLIPAVMLLGLGNVPAVIATTIYALPPIIRLTDHGIRQVDREIIEAAQAFGSTGWQVLFKVQIPQALPTIMTGVNQTIMMAISMVVTCSMIGATGLGSEVIKGINRLESGRGFAAGIAIVIMAIIFDRMTQGLVNSKEN